VFASKIQIYGKSFLFKEYLTEEENRVASDNPLVKLDMQLSFLSVILLICDLSLLEMKVQEVKFINEVYSIEPTQGNLYTLEIVFLFNIFSIMLQHSIFLTTNSLKVSLHSAEE
jgi:hypothetical protein